MNATDFPSDTSDKTNKYSLQASDAVSASDKISNPTAKQEFSRTLLFDSSDTKPGANNDQPSATFAQPRTISWSGHSESVIGYSLDEIESSRDWWLEHVHPDDLHNVISNLASHLRPFPFGRQHCAEARMWSADYKFRKKDGSYILISERGITTRDDAGHAIGLTSTIFDKKLQRNQRMEHKKQLEARNYLAVVAENTPSGIFLMDAQGYCIFMNKAAELITGFTYEELVDYTFHASCHSCKPDGSPYPRTECPVFRNQQAGTSAQNESEIFVHKDGHFYDIVFSVSPVGDYGSSGAVIEFRDVTEQRKMERERIDAILENQQKSIVLKESENFKEAMTSFVSFICHELRNPLQGITASAEFLLESTKELSLLTEHLSSAKQDITNPETEGNINMGALSLHSSSLTNGTTMNTASKRSILEANTISSLQKLLANAEQLIANIQVCADHQALIINNTLDLSRLDAGKVEVLPEVIDVFALGRQAISMMTAKAHGKSINLSLNDAKRPPIYLKADATMLTQVLLNLISNAVKFTPTNGIISVNLRVSHRLDDSSQVTLHASVTDNGLGMTAEEKSRLFQRFSQANRKVAQVYGGSGLGLSISKELVRAMGGEMHVESAKGEGSTFGFTTTHVAPSDEEVRMFLHSNTPGTGSPADVTSHHIPRPEAMPLTAAAEAFNQTNSRFGLIGIAEDNPINLSYLAKMLTSLGYNHVLCTNGEEMLAQFLQPNNNLSLIIMDMSMPIMDGLESSRLIREAEAARVVKPTNCTAIPIVALSGNALTEQVGAAFAAGVSDYMIKPAKKADLVKMIRYWEQVVHTGGPHVPMLESARKLARSVQITANTKEL